MTTAFARVSLTLENLEVNACIDLSQFPFDHFFILLLCHMGNLAYYFDSFSISERLFTCKKSMWITELVRRHLRCRHVSIISQMRPHTMDYNYATTRYYDARPAYRGAQIVWYIANIIEIILLLRFFLRLVGANTGAAFTQFVYNISAPFMAPFQNIIPSSSAGSSLPTISSRARRACCSCSRSRARATRRTSAAWWRPIDLLIRVRLDLQAVIRV